MTTSEPTPLAHVDEQELDVFLHHYFNLDLPGGSVSSILTAAFTALIDAGVVVFDDGTPAKDIQIKVHGGRVFLGRTNPHTGKGTGAEWIFGDGAPTPDTAITGLVQLLTAIMNAPPFTGETPRPWTRN
jgi:hypothetical protein